MLQYVRMLPLPGGQELWRGGDYLVCDFEGFDLNGNVMLRETDQDKVSISIRRPQTGAVMEKYLLPADKPKIKLIEQWGMYADIVRTGDMTYTIGIYDITDGRRMMVLKEDESATAVSRKYEAEVAANNAAMEAAARSNEASWQRHDAVI